jgi:hypothetical protein
MNEHITNSTNPSQVISVGGHEDSHSPQTTRSMRKGWRRPYLPQKNEWIHQKKIKRTQKKIAMHVTINLLYYASEFSKMQVGRM